MSVEIKVERAYMMDMDEKGVNIPMCSFKCPVCGREFEHAYISNNFSLIICPKCNTIFSIKDVKVLIVCEARKLGEVKEE
ncbi:MAG: hypothetical protein DRO39_05600 [Thermoprotei archaeon]|nr:MAG: hypothetical protein DRO39_05600 [Thermoprotei archaeon]